MRSWTKVKMQIPMQILILGNNQLKVNYSTFKRTGAISPAEPRGRIQRKTWCMGPYDGADYITSPYVHSRVDSKTFTMGNPMPESTLSPLSETYDLASDSALLDEFSCK